MRCDLQPKAEFRKSERFGHKYIIKLENDVALTPYYAVSYNLSERGMYFKSLFEQYPGSHIVLGIDDYTLGQNKVLAKVVWCKGLENTANFRYGVGVEFLKPVKNFSLKASLSTTPQMKTPNKNENADRAMNMNQPSKRVADR
jgi:hypothetical protein